MPDREKVIEYLNSEIYRAEQSVNDIWLECVEVKLLRDALDLLKEQEAKQVETEVLNEIDRLYRCPSCHITMIFRKQPYCHWCGQGVKWE